MVRKIDFNFLNSRKEVPYTRLNRNGHRMKCKTKKKQDQERNFI